MENFKITNYKLLITNVQSNIKQLSVIGSLLLLMAMTFNSCGVIETFAGAGFDPAQLAKAREAKILELRLKSANALKDRLSNSDPLDNADITIYLNENILNRLLNQYESSTGMLDETTDYIIKDVKLELLNGAAIVKIELFAHNEDYNIDIDLIMDCLLTIEPVDMDLALKLEPFNIMPVVTTRGIYSAARTTIDKLIRLNLAELSKKLPYIKIPVNIENEIALKGSKTDIKSKINISIENPDRLIVYQLKIKEILVFDEKVLIALNLNKIEVN